MGRAAADGPPVVLVTGCSEGGIGWHLCASFAAAGCRVFAASRRADAARGLEARGCTLVALDVTSEASIEAAVSAVLEAAGRVDVLVNNAGIGCSGPLAEVPLAHVRLAYETNVFGLLAVTQAVVRRSMSVCRRGVVVNVASVVGAVATPFAGGYCSSKAAVMSASDALRMELAPWGIRVVTLCPGAVRSNIGANNMARLDASVFRMYAPFADAIAARAVASQSEKSTPGEAFAATVTAALLRNLDAPPPVLWAGHMATLFRVLTWLPRRLRDTIMARPYGLDKPLPPQHAAHD